MNDQATIDVIIPTWNNPQYLTPCLYSLLRSRRAYPFRILLVNNGHPDNLPPEATSSPHVQVVQAESNLGWEGGLQLGLRHSTAEFVVFCNDDIFVPPVSYRWAAACFQSFRDPLVAAVGPSSNVVMGIQNIFGGLDPNCYAVPYLIGFFLMIRRSALEAVGGIDATLPGGDDLDLCWRFWQAGYRCIARLDTFIYHHGFKTGERVHGSYWNSGDMQERTDAALIRKHGFLGWHAMLSAYTFGRGPEDDHGQAEGDALRVWVTGDVVLDLGCGDKKLVPQAIGIDLVPAGQTTYLFQTSAADVVADVFEPLPFPDRSVDTVIARHIFEHASDPVLTLERWGQVLRLGGRLVVAAPNEDLFSTIPVDPTHRHAWSPGSFRRLAERCGYRLLGEVADCGNGISFVSAVERR